MSNCDNCSVHHKANLVQLGINVDGFNYIIALAGNPNTGKSSIFNNLTGLRQHTGNWPGKTVTRAEGAYFYNEQRYKVIDLPGTYSLLSTSTDEDVARNFILFGRPDVTVIVADATRLQRNLNLALQVLEITDRAVLALNLMDEAKRNGIEIDTRALSRELGIPVIPMVARRREGMTELLKIISEVASGQYLCKPHKLKSHSKKVENAISALTQKLALQFPDLPNLRWVAMRLLEGDPGIMDSIKDGKLKELEQSV